MVDSIHLIVRIDSIHLMANSIKGRLSKHLMVNSIKGRPFTIHPLTCNENCPPPLLFTNHHPTSNANRPPSSTITTPQAMQTEPPFQQSPPHKQCTRTPPFFYQSPLYKNCKRNPPPSSPITA